MTVKSAERNRGRANRPRGNLQGAERLSTVIATHHAENRVERRRSHAETILYGKGDRIWQRRKGRRGSLELESGPARRKGAFNNNAERH